MLFNVRNSTLTVISQYKCIIFFVIIDPVTGDGIFNCVSLFLHSLTTDNSRLSQLKLPDI